MKKSPTKVKRITVSNLKAVSEMTADFNGATAIITGGNNKGKSSFLRSIPDRIRGIKPEVVLKFGEREGYAELELTTGEKFIWSFTLGGRESLQFISQDNIKGSVTKEIANRYFPPVFDVDGFLEATPKKQRAILQQLVGLDFTEIDQRYQKAFDDRTFKNRKKTEERAKVTEILDLPVKEYPIIDLEKELAGIDLHNADYLRTQERQKLFIDTRSTNEKRIEELKAQIRDLESSNRDHTEKIDTLDKWLAEPANKPKDNAESLKRKIATARRENEAIRKNNEARKQDKIAAEAEDDWRAADALVKKIEQERTDMITNAKIPQGFTFTADGIEYNGYPMTKEQLSSSGIYIAALKLASMNLGEVRTLHFDASFLDNKSLEEIEKWADKNKLQLLIEVVDRDGEEISYELLN